MFSCVDFFKMEKNDRTKQLAVIIPQLYLRLGFAADASKLSRMMKPVQTLRVGGSAVIGNARLLSSVVMV